MGHGGQIRRSVATIERKKKEKEREGGQLSSAFRMSKRGRE